MALPMHCTCLPEDRPNGRSAPQLGDLVAALYNRKQTGKGHYIDIALVDGIFSVLENTVPAYLNCGLKPGRLGNRHPNGGPYDTYKAVMWLSWHPTNASGWIRRVACSPVYSVEQICEDEHIKETNDPGV